MLLRSKLFMFTFRLATLMLWRPQSQLPQKAWRAATPAANATACGKRGAGNVAVRRREIVRRIVRIRPIPVHNGGLIVRNVDLVRRSRFDHDVLLLVFRLDRDGLLLGRFELAVGSCAGTQPLD